MWMVTWTVWSVCTVLSSTVFGELHQRPVIACGGNLTGEAGFIVSPGHPGIYPSNNKCVWRITVPRGRVVSLSFRVLDLENDGLCRYDYVDVHDGHVNGQRLGRFCGTRTPAALVSSGNKMHVVLVSDANTAGSGFLAAYAAVHPNERGRRYCGGRLEEPSGTLQSPNWPERDYPVGVTCSWVIVANDNQTIELKFEKFDVERDSSCRYDHVAVYNGLETNEARKIGRFCGDSPPTAIISDGSHLLIQFVSDLSLTADGFIGHYLFRPKNPNSALSSTTTPPTVTTTSPSVLTYSEDLCKQKCRRTGTIERHYCSSNFVITGTLISAAMRGRSVLATFSITSLHKEGNLTVQQAGKTRSIRTLILCKKCPLVRRGLNYIVMGHVDTQGQGIVSPHNFVMAFKTTKPRNLAVMNDVRC
ncbi:procollagen C-endopeptidase enhancer 2 [Brachyhypopomus gauderio]|uniref:procollagen C-endopeptidase enhancer 2 n=1 Tax=Brachyhypopomus gauderio TaxID=698409 RepID=UPI0040418510